jgi:hypothetical protein
MSNNKILQAILIVGALVALTYVMAIGYVPGSFETVQPDYLDPTSSNYLRLILINNGTTNDTMEFMIQFHHQKAIPFQTWTRTLMSVTGVRSYLGVYKTSGQINQTQFDAGRIQLNAILSTPMPETEPTPIIINETIITPIQVDGGVTIPPQNDDEETIASDDEPNGGNNMEIYYWIMLGIVSMIMAWVVTSMASIFLPQLKTPTGMIVSISGFFALIFYIMALIFGMV